MYLILGTVPATMLHASSLNTGYHQHFQGPNAATIGTVKNNTKNNAIILFFTSHQTSLSFR
jgi:hypothetical protein